MQSRAIVPLRIRARSPLSRRLCRDNLSIASLRMAGSESFSFAAAERISELVS